MATVTNKKKIKATTPRVPKLLEIVSPEAMPDVVRLKDLSPVEMFRYPSGNPVAIYMVQDLSKIPMKVPNQAWQKSFVALTSGKVFMEDVEKVIIPVTGTLRFEDDK